MPWESENQSGWEVKDTGVALGQESVSIQPPASSAGELEQAVEPSILDKTSDFVLSDLNSEQKKKSLNSIEYSKAFNIKPSAAWELEESLNTQFGGTKNGDAGFLMNRARESAQAVMGVVEMASETGKAVGHILGAAGIPSVMQFSNVDGNFDIDFITQQEFEEKGGKTPIMKAGEALQPKTVVGGAVRGISQFLAGWIPTVKGLKYLPYLKKAGTVAAYSRAFIAGAAVDAMSFDPHVERLSNMIEKVPALHSPITDYLKSDPDDSEAEGRFKNALEGLFLGGAAESAIRLVKPLMNSIKLLRANAKVKGKPIDIKPPVSDEVITKGQLAKDVTEEVKIDVDTPLDKDLPIKQKVEPAKIPSEEARLTKEADPLTTEARKYKSADEFVESQKKLFRGKTNVERDERTVKGVLSTSENADIAKIFQGEKGMFEEFILDPNAKIIKVEDITPELLKTKEMSEITPNDWIEYAKENGYDVIDMKSLKIGIQSKTDAKLKGLEDEMKILNPDVLKTKQQLTDIWNKAQEPKKVAPEEKSIVSEEASFDEKTVRNEIKFLESFSKGKKLTAKQTIGQVTGLKTKDIIEVDEGKALKSQIRLEAKAAREAFKAGKREKALEHKRKQAKLIDLMEIRKLAKDINKDVPGNVDLKYAEMIDALKSDVDTAFRAEKTIERRSKTLDFLERNPDAVELMPDKTLREAFKKPLQDFTKDDLLKVKEQIDQLKKRGQTQLSHKKKMQKAKIKKVVDSMIPNIMEGKPLKRVSTPVTKATTKSKPGKIIRTADSIVKRPYAVLDKLDNLQDFKGPAHDFFFNKLNDKFDAELRAKDERSESVHKSMKDLDITVKDLLEEKTINNNVYRVDEMMGVYVFNKNPEALATVTYGNKISPETQTEIIKALPDKFKKFADSILKDYESRKTSLADTTREIENRDMGSSPNYAPMTGKKSQELGVEEAILEELDNRSKLRATPSKGMTKERAKNIPETLQQGINLGLYETWTREMPKHEQYINRAGHIKDMNAVLSDKDLQLAMEKSSKRFGPEYLEALRHNINRFANSNFYRPKDVFNMLSAELRQNSSLYALLGNVPAMMKQVPSLSLYLPDSGVEAMTQSIGEFITGPVALWKKVREKDPQVKHRSQERELDEIKNLDENAYRKLKKASSDIGMSGFKFFDGVAITMGWNAVYLKNLHKGEAIAVREARNATLRTQPQSNPKDLPDLYDMGEASNWLLRFTNQLNQIYNLTTHTIPADVKRGELQKAAMGAAAVTLSALWIWSINNKRLPEKPEDVKDAMSDQAIAILPMIGKTILQKRQGYGSGIDIFKAAGTMTEAIQKKSALKILDALAIGAGGPGVFVKRTGKAIKKGSLSPIFGSGGKKKKKIKR